MATKPKARASTPPAKKPPRRNGRTPRKMQPSKSSDEVTIFISYAGADAVIADVLYRELTEIDRNRVRCFQDTKTIGSGKNWKKELDQWLEKADWLVCLHTGEQSEFCGYEVGVFEKTNVSNLTGDDSLVVCLHDVTQFPTVFDLHQNRQVVSPTEEQRSAIGFNEDDFFIASPLGVFFSNIFSYKDLYPTGNAAEAQRQTQDLIGKVKRLTKAFEIARGTDVRTDSPIQLQIDVHVSASAGMALGSIPDTSKVTGTYASLRLFGLAPPMPPGKAPSSTWEEIKKAGSSEYRATAPWIERLEGDMIEISNRRVASSVDALLSSNGRVYRAILSRHIVYENETQIFQILFIETLPRQFIGNKDTSLILAGIVLAARLRAAYLEDPDTLDKKFGEEVSFANFQVNCWQLHYDLDRLRLEAIELGVLDPDLFVAAFGKEKKAFADNLLKTSMKSREKLFETLPEITEPLQESEREIVRAAVYKYFSEIDENNGSFLVEALEILKSRVASQLRSSGLRQDLKAPKH